MIITNLASDGISGAGPYSTASISPKANSLILLSINLRNGASTNPAVPTISGNGLTWELVDSINQDNNSVSRLTTFLFRSMGPSPSAGVITITPGEVDTGCGWSVNEFQGVNINGRNGIGAIVQHNTAAQLVSPTVSSLLVTLAAFGDPNNVGFGVFGAGSDDSPSIGTGFNQLSTFWNSGPGTDLFTEYKVNDNTVDVNFTADFEVGLIAVEIKAGSAKVGSMLQMFQ